MLMHLWMWSLIQKLKIPLRNRLNSEELKSQVYVDQLVTVISVAKQQTERNCNIAAFSKQRECINIAYNSCPSCPSTLATGCCRQMMPPLAQCDKFQPSYVINAYLCLAMLHACTLECQHMMLCVWRWIPTKAESQWPTGEDHQAALATSGSTRSRRMPTPYRYLRRGDLRSPGPRNDASVIDSNHGPIYLIPFPRQTAILVQNYTIVSGAWKTWCAPIELQ